MGAPLAARRAPASGSRQMRVVGRPGPSFASAPPAERAMASAGRTAHAVLILKDLLDRELHYLKCLQGLVHVRLSWM